MKLTLQSVHPALMVILMIFCIVSTASAGVTGRLKGKVVDKNSQEALPNAVVKIEGTYFETTTNSSGEFSFIGIDAGTYSVSAVFESYQKIIYTGFPVYPDIVNEINFELSSQDIHTDAIVLEAESVSSKSDDPYMRGLVDSKTFSRQPHHSLNDIILQSSGDVYSRTNTVRLTDADNANRTEKLHFRGGAAGESGFYLDGLRLNDGATGHAFLSLPYRAIDLVTVNTGSYDAKYGQFGTGMVQIVPKRGGDTFTSSAEFISDAAASAFGSYSYGHNAYNATVSGPIIKNSLRFFAAGEFSTTNDADPGVLGQPVFKLSPDGVHGFKDPAENDTVLFGTNSDGSLKYKKGPRPDRSNSEQLTNLYGNFSYTPNPSLQVDLTVSYSFTKRNTFFTSYLFNPDKVPHNERSTSSTALSAKYFLSKKMFLQGRLNYYTSAAKLTMRNLFSQSNIVTYNFQEYLTGNDGYPSYLNDNLVFSIGRGYIYYQKNESNALSANIEWNWQLHRDHFIECGIGIQQNTERLLALYDIFGNPAGGANNIYGYQVTHTGNYPDDYYEVKHLNSDIPNSFDGPKKPIMSYLYIQDQFASGIFLFNGGIRGDYFYNGVKDYTFSYYQSNKNNVASDLFRSDITGLPQIQNRSKTTIHWSPRIAMSADFSKNLVGRANYGWFYQIPNFQNIFVSNQKLETHTFFPPFLQYLPNSSLNPQKTEAIEIGFNYSTTKNLILDLSYFWNEVSNVMLAGLAVNYPNQLGILENNGSTQITGFNIRVEKRFFDHLRGGVFATYLKSTLTASVTESGFVPLWVYGGESETIAPTDHEQRWTAKCFAEFQFLRNEGPVLAASHPFENVSFFVIANMASGFPYTPTTIEKYRLFGYSVLDFGHLGYERNSRRTPSTLNIDVKISKQFSPFEHYRATAYLEILNLLNRKNPIAVFSGTGDPQNDGYLATSEGQAMSVREKQQYDYVNHNNFNYSNPRLVNMGVMLEF